MAEAMIIQAVALLAPLLQRAVQGQLSAQAIADLQTLSEREFAAAVEDWKASEPAPKPARASRRRGGGTR